MTQTNVMELTRQLLQASLIREYVALLPSPLDDRMMQTVLDIGCGPGTWAIDAAFTLPDAHVIGLDVDPDLVRYAQARALSQGRHNVSFQLADARQPLPFAKRTCSLVHLQLATSWLTDAGWLPLLQEARRVLQLGAFLMITECQLPESSSRALTQLIQLLLRLLRQMHLGMCQDNKDELGVPSALASLLVQADFRAITMQVVEIPFSFSSPATHQRCFEDLLALFSHLQEQILDAGLAMPGQYQRLLKQFIQEVWREEFVGHCKLYTLTAQV